MKTKTMRKLVAFVSMVAMSLSFSSTVLAQTTVGSDQVGTSLTIGSAGGLRPIVKAKWEMKGPSFVNGVYSPSVSLEGTDDSVAAGAQFNAPGVWGANMNYTVCAVVTDPNGVADVQSVYADIKFPTDRKMHVSPSDTANPAYDANEIDNPTGGCGAQIEENTLTKLTKEAGIDLFCNKIQQNNNNLPTFNTEPIQYDYNEICNTSSGQLYEETAYVYCADKSLTWEHPAGNYGVEVSGVDGTGPGTELLNTFNYVEFTGFDIDFSSVQYKDVQLNVRSQVDGDRNFNPTSSTMPTVRNIGNTRVEMLIAQDDMNFGQRDFTTWNVNFDARVGNIAANWNGLFNPFKIHTVAGNPTYAQYNDLMEILDLSETEKMDFAILVSKWSQGMTGDYHGTMWLDAETAIPLVCGTPA